MKFDFSSLILLSEKRAIDIFKEASRPAGKVLLSIVTITFSSLECHERLTSVTSGTIRGRTFRLWGAIGAMMKTLESGEQMGPHPVGPAGGELFTVQRDVDT